MPTHKTKQTFYNLSPNELIRESLERNEGVLTNTGALAVETGKYTGRSPENRYIVVTDDVRDDINWGTTNQPLDEGVFNQLHKKVENYLSDKDTFVFEGVAGANEKYQLPIKTINEYAWHNLFASRLFIDTPKVEKQKNDNAFTILSAPGFKANPKVDGTNSEAFVIINFKKRMVLIGGTQYAGEMKKSIFSVMNYLLPRQNVLPMHCSANVNKEGEVSLFFGLSGTGKTTLSADPKRFLIGDDEHGWGEDGVFNIEGGCYAKAIDLKEENEPEIYRAIKNGAVLENVVLDEDGAPDYSDSSLTENTRAAYSIEAIPNAKLPSYAGHPNTIVFLTADAFGVLPPISALTKKQAMFYFLNGYTSKLAGTEIGVTEPQATFSACFGSPFLPMEPTVYAEMLGELIDKHNPDIYLINTGWVGGAYGEGERIKLSLTRKMVESALDGSLKNAPMKTEYFFGLSIPTNIKNVPSEVLDPKDTWNNLSNYTEKAKKLKNQFEENFKKYQ